MKISLAMIVKDEEKHIARCLESAIPLVDEIVIVDTGSTDNTIRIIKGFKDVKLYHFKWCDNFSIARNFSIEKATGDYLLVLDADEYITHSDRSELEDIMTKNQVGRIKVCSHFLNKDQVRHSQSYITRFFPKDTQYRGAIHEQIQTQRKKVNLELSVNHEGYFQTNKGERNIPLLLKELKKKPNDVYYLFQLGKELRINKQYDKAFYFLYNAYGLIDLNDNYYGELVIELINSGKEIGNKEVITIIEKNKLYLDNLADFHFSVGLFYLDYCLKVPSEANLETMQKIENSFLHCLKIHKDPNCMEYLQGSSSYLAAYNLGVYYEVVGDIKKAFHYYNLSLKFGYSIAELRLSILEKEYNILGL
ncbi:glycosyltransferase family 2 protein [Priestia koreensis]|uniref:glycosyltransferase family 2 protein n=1 Tax=Priestia koreensis TaxID=284581 RepID=UPI003457A715